MAEETSTAGSAGGKATNFFAKHKTGIIIAGVIGALFIGFLIFRSSQNSSGSTQSATGTGGTPLSPTDLSNLTGPAGATGATGATGPQGPTGKTGPPGHRGPPGRLPPPKPKKHPHDPKAPVGHPAVLTASRTQFHTVQPGETTSSVAMRHGMDNSSLFGMNRAAMGGSLQVRPGQRLQVK